MDLLLYREQIVFLVRRMSGYQSLNSIVMDLHSTWTVYIVNGYQSANSIVVDLPFYMNQSVPCIQFLCQIMTVRYQSLNSIVMDLPLACLGSCPEAVILILINDNKSIMCTDSKKSDLFPSLMTGNEENDNTRSSLYSSQMKSMSHDASQNSLFLSSCWPVWQSD